MSDDERRSNLARQILEAAEEKLARSIDSSELTTEKAVKDPLHELQVHKAELEMQNEELRRTQLELEATRARYFDLYDLAPVGYCTLSEKGLILETNLAAAALLGVSRGALVKQLFSRFILKEDQSIYYLHRKQLFATGAPQTCELRMVKQDGTEFWAYLEVTAALDADGAPVCHVILYDTTERKRMEEALRYNSTIIAETIDALITTKNDEGFTITNWNPGAEKIYGWKKEEVLGRSSLFLRNEFPGQDPKEILEKILEAGLYEGELIQSRKDGTRVFIDATLTARKDNKGETTDWICINRDITERKRAEEALRESEERYRTLFETMTEGVVLLSPDGQILHANLAAERILGLKRAEIEDRRHDGLGWELLHPDGTPMPPEEMAGTLTIGGIRTLKDVEIGFKRPDGLVSWVNLNAAPLLDKAGELKSVVGTFRDSTEYEQLKRETAKKITGQLAAGIAHQIRNPLFIISLSVQSIEKKLPAKDPQRRLTQAILSKVHKLDVITADLVHLGKYHQLHITNASLRKCLEQALILIRAPAKTQQVKVVRRYTLHLPRAWIDVEAMDEVFANLLTNALEAMPGGGLLTVETSLDEKRKELLVRIQDNGCGIPKAAQERIFNPFFTTKESGSGLGLVFCQRIVEEH
ncbi:MAG: PAS domain S-box protein, partial [bacterium]